jgi:hypothetical protein
MSDEPIVAETLIKYKIKLSNKLNDYKSGTFLEAILLPVRVQGTDDTWVNKWFIYDGDKSVAILEFKDQCFEIFSMNKKKNKEK